MRLPSLLPSEEEEEEEEEEPPAQLGEGIEAKQETTASSQAASTGVEEAAQDAECDWGDDKNEFVRTELLSQELVKGFTKEDEREIEEKGGAGGNSGCHEGRGFPSASARASPE